MTRAGVDPLPQRALMHIRAAETWLRLAELSRRREKRLGETISRP
jgi:hypothetical protein